MSFIDTERVSISLRDRAIDLPGRRILISRLTGSSQELDLTEPVNCAGYGRIRHFRYQQYPDWSDNPLPILPAAKALGRPHAPTVRAQVFQNAACNWRCWYCFVDFDRLAANRKVSSFFTADELISAFACEENRADVLDLSGGQPDLVPEWVLWTMEALERKGLAGKIFLWSDDNLSNRYHWDYLSEAQRAYMVKFPSYSRVGCFKGFDESSFSFNTKAAPELFQQQFEVFRSLVFEGYDIYAYVTFTSPRVPDLRSSVARFADKLQIIHRSLPLRTVPLKIAAFTPTRSRMGPEHEEALSFQHEVHAAWLEELQQRFSLEERERPITEVPLGPN